MEIPNPLTITVHIKTPITESNLEDIHRRNISYCLQCIIDIGNFFISVITLSVFIALPVIEIVIGIVYQNECSMNSYIPIYLIVAGIISIINLIFAIFGWIFVWPLVNDLKLKKIKVVFSDARIIYKIISSIAILFSVFNLAWFIVGNIWVFSARFYVQYTDPIGFPNTYCNCIVYLSGFWSIIVKYIFVLVIICRLNCYTCNDTQKIIDQTQSNITITIQ